jgi:hypothetical protein
LHISTSILTEDWSSFVNTHPHGTVFQSPGMYGFCRSVRKFDPLVLAAKDGEGRLCGILLGIFIWEKEGIGRRLSSRLVVYGGPLLAGTNEQKREALDMLLGELSRSTRGKALFTQFRNYFSWEGCLDVFEKHGFGFLERLNYIIRIPDTGCRMPDTGCRIPGMSASRRRQIRKGLGSGAVIIEPENLEQVREFYDILYRLYRYKVRKPLADWSFFENFYKRTLPNTETLQHCNTEPIGIIRLVQYRAKIIGGILAPVFRDQCIYEWYVCGLDREYREQHPSVLATWAALQYAMEHNIRYFDFMGVGKPGVPYGVRDFKARFGGEEVNYGRLTRINNKFLYHIAELGFNVLALFKKI